MPPWHLKGWDVLQRVLAVRRREHDEVPNDGDRRRPALNRDEDLATAAALGCDCGCSTARVFARLDLDWKQVLSRTGLPLLHVRVSPFYKK